MSNDLIDVTDEMPSYNGLERAATVMGMPLVPIMGTLGGLMFITMMALPFLQAKAFLILLLAIPIIAFIRQQTMQDDQALRIRALEVQWVLRRRNFGMFGKTNTILGNKYGRQQYDYKRFFEQDS